MPYCRNGSLRFGGWLVGWFAFSCLVSTSIFNSLLLKYKTASAMLKGNNKRCPPVGQNFE